jgi:O-antigen/teichoic acid export membrane protein
MSDKLGHSEGKPKTSVETSVQDQKQTDILTVASGGSISFIGNVGNRGIKYVYSIALIWGLGAEDFGLFTLALAITLFIGVIANLGMNQSIIRFGAIYNRSEGRIGIHRITMAAMRIVLPFGFLLMLILLLFADTIAVNIFNKPVLASLIRALGLSVPFMSVQISLLSATTVLRTMKYMVVVMIFQPLIGLLIAIPLLVYDMGVQAVALSLTVSYILATGLAFYFYMRVVYYKEKKTRKVSMWNLIKFSLPLTFTEWIQFANDRTELFFLGLMPGAIDVGIYKIADSLSGLEPTLRQSLSRILAPLISDLSNRKEIKQLESLYKTTAKWSFTLALALFLIFLLFAEGIMNFFDPAFVSGVGVLIVLGFAQLINAGAGSCGSVLIMSGRSDLSLMNTIVLFVVNITLDYFLIPIYGLAGAALAGSVAVILITFLRVLEVWLILHIHPFKWSFAKPIMAGLSSLALVHILRTYINSESIVVVIIYSLIFVAVYITLIYLLNLDPEDMLVLNAIRRKIALPIRDLKGNHKPTT